MHCFRFLPSPQSAGTDTTWHQRDAGTLAGIETSSITSEVTVEFDWSIMASACKRESSFACTSRISTSWNHLRYTCLRNTRVPAKQLDECSTLCGIYTTTLGRDDELARSVLNAIGEICHDVWKWDGRIFVAKNCEPNSENANTETWLEPHHDTRLGR